MSSSVYTFGTRVYRVGVERGWQLADRMFSFDGSAYLPTREDIVNARPYWIFDPSDYRIEEYLDGFAVGFTKRVSGLRVDGSRRQ